MLITNNNQYIDSLEIRRMSFAAWGVSEDTQAYIDRQTIWNSSFGQCTEPLLDNYVNNPAMSWISIAPRKVEGFLVQGKNCWCRLWTKTDITKPKYHLSVHLHTYFTELTIGWTSHVFPYIFHWLCKSSSSWTIKIYNCYFAVAPRICYFVIALHMS